MARTTIACILIGVSLLSVCGCAPNTQGMMRPTLPWTRGPLGQTPGNTASGFPRIGGRRPGDDLTGIFSTPTLPPSATKPNSTRWGYLNEMLRRADQQELLAEKQRQELVDLRRLQEEQLAKDREYVTKQRELERQLLAKRYNERTQRLSDEYAAKEKLLVDREQRYRGRFDQMQGRATNLDANNRDLHAQLAKTERERQLLKDELDLVKGRLDDATQKLTQTRTVGLEANRRLQESDRRIQALQASAAKRVGHASIRANRSVSRTITARSIPGMDVRQDGDHVRIIIPSDQLFMQGLAVPLQGSTAYLNQLAAVLEQHYPQQLVAIEAHSDHGSSSLRNSAWRSQHQLTAAQAYAVFEQLTARRINPNRLTVMGHGGNYPLYSDGTREGQARNRRVEIIVSPEVYGQ